jgi:hypothetical protein
VTYLTAAGSPTIVLDCTADTQYCKVTRSNISRAWVSFPSPLKHMSFDGRLLHGAPAVTQLAPDAVRVTFLANVRLPRSFTAAQRALMRFVHHRNSVVIDFPHVCFQVWLNHHPMSLRPLPSSTAKQLQPLFPAIALSLKRNACTALAADSSYECKAYSFGPTGSETQLTLPLPASVTQCAGAGQSLSIRCAMVHRSPPSLLLSLTLSLPSSQAATPGTLRRQ